MREWIDHAEEIAERAERELEALVAVSSPSGDGHGADEAAAIATALLPRQAQVERVPCSSPDHARDLLARVRGTGARRILLLGHLDTVVAHGDHRPLTRAGDRLVGSGAVDMKGGVVLALGILDVLADRPEAFAEATLLLVMDEEWRTAPFGHAARFAGYDACLCFEAGQRTPDGGEAVVIARKAAGTLRVRARGLAAHSGSAPDKGRNALLAAAEVARRVAALHAPREAGLLTVVPTIMRSGEAFNVVPDAAELIVDLRAGDAAAFQRVIDAVPRELDGVAIEHELMRVWPGMDARATTAPVLERASALLGAPIVGAGRGGASDASHFATVVPVTIDGLGPRGGHAHHPDEFVLVESLRDRARVALAVVGAILDG